MASSAPKKQGIDDIKLDLEGKTVSVPEDFSLGQISFTDIMNILLEKLQPFIDAQKEEMNQFMLDLRKGESKAVITAGISILLGLFAAYIIISGLMAKDRLPPKEEEKEEEEPIVLRDFTREQLREFYGTNGKKIYIGIKGEVYDATKGSNFYGEGASYHCFAGRDATRAMAKFSFDENELSNPDVSDIGPFERSMLEDFIHKFKYYRQYPVVGRIVVPPASRTFTREELKDYKGTQPVPEGRVDAPIYVGAAGKVFDVSFGGKEFYGEGGPYHLFAGLDASRALARMSFVPEDVNNPNISDLTEKELKVLNDWVDKFENAKKYPIVGTLA
jgi:membrane-associated progesterone receptor component